MVCPQPGGLAKGCLGTMSGHPSPKRSPLAAEGAGPAVCVPVRRRGAYPSENTSQSRLQVHVCSVQTLGGGVPSWWGAVPVPQVGGQEGGGRV